MTDHPQDENNTRPTLLRRAVAFVIDFLLVLVVLQVLATLAFSVTGGRVQSAGPLEISFCHWPPDPAVQFPHGDLRVSTDGREISQSLCTLGLPAMPHGRILTVAVSHKSGAWTISQSDRVALDLQNRAVWVLWLGVFAIPLLWLYRTIAELRSGKTIAKKWLGLYVQSESGQQFTMRQAMARNLWLLWPLFAIDLVREGPMLGTPNLLLLTPLFGWLMLAATSVCILWYLAVIIQIARRKNLFHDRLAGTSVVRKS